MRCSEASRSTNVLECCCQYRISQSSSLLSHLYFLALRQRAALAEAQAELDVVLAQLKDAKDRLAGVQNRLAELQKGFDDAVAKKQVQKLTSISWKLSQIKIVLPRPESSNSFTAHMAT